MKTILNQNTIFTEPEIGTSFDYDHERVWRVIWKIARGLYFQETSTFLPENTKKRIAVASPDRMWSIADARWWSVLQDSQSIGAHGIVFDYKWLCHASEGIRGNMVAMCFWAKIFTFALFHDPACRCEECATVGRRNGSDPVPAPE